MRRPHAAIRVYYIHAAAVLYRILETATGCTNESEHFNFSNTFPMSRFSCFESISIFSLKMICSMESELTEGAV